MNRQLKKQLHHPLFKILKTINRSLDFCVYQSTQAFFPQLKIKGLGELALPLCEAQAKQLIKLCHKAPYGKGTQTLVDQKVRNTWELDASCITEKNKNWQQFITKTLRQCEKELDLQGQTLVAHPYKLLIYEKGSFFLTHQDTEKEEGMVATLIIALPSAHKGGTLTIQHHGESIAIDFSQKKNLYHFQSALFYADCHHEIAPVTEGYRLNLVYNICFKGQRKLNTFDFSIQQQQLSTLFKNWKNNLKEEDNKQLIISLDHQYSADGFSLNTLKGMDRSRADILLNAAEKAGYIAYICLLEKYESLNLYDGYSDGDIIDEYMSIIQLMDASGKKINLCLSVIDEENILCQHQFKKAFEEEREGYMGNHGNTLSRWYRYAAVILWPKENQLEILIKNDILEAISYLISLYRKKAPDFSENLHYFFTTVNKSNSHDPDFTLLTLTLLENNKILMQKYCCDFLFTQEKLPTITQIKKALDLCSWDYLEQHLDIQNKTIRTNFFKLVNKIKTTALKNPSPALQKLLYRAISESSNDNSWNSNALTQLEIIFPLLLQLPNPKSTKSLTEFLHKKTKKLNAETEFLPYIEALYSKSNSTNQIIFQVATKWLTKQFKDYQQCIRQKPKKATVEIIPSTLECQCEDCQQIIDFMQNKKDKIELALFKAECVHLSAQLDKYKVEVTYEIHKNRRPWRFNIQKIGAEQREKINNYNIAKEFMGRLEKLSC